MVPILSELNSEKIESRGFNEKCDKDLLIAYVKLRNTEIKNQL